MTKLTDKQCRMMQMVIDGMTDKEIAAQRGLAVSTVKNTMVVIYEKLQARNRAQAVYRYCFDNEE